LLFVVVLGLLLIPRYGVAGALIADGISRAITGTMQLFFLWPLPHKYPLAFTLRLLLALTLAALPSLLWHPANHILLALSATIFLLLCIGLLLLIKPLDMQDIGMIEGVNPRMDKYLRWFAPQRR
jgi:O-antigen/teichoic acid export membrane protein